MREPSDALQALTQAVGTALRADAAVVRVREDGSGDLVARTVWAASSALSAELVASRHRPGAVHRAESALVVPIERGDEVVGELELVRAAEPFGTDDRSFAESAAAQAGLVLATALGVGIDGSGGRRERELELAGEALALATGGGAAQLVHLAVEAGGASGALLWRLSDRGPLELAAEVAVEDAQLAELEQVAAEMLESKAPVAVGRSVASVRLGEPPLGVLQLVFESGVEPLNGSAGLLATFGVRAAQALRASESLVETQAELERSRALVAVISQAIAQLSLSHTLETAVERIAELLAVERVAVYLLDGGTAAAGRGPRPRRPARARRGAAARPRARPFPWPAGVVHLAGRGSPTCSRAFAASSRSPGSRGYLPFRCSRARRSIGLLAVYPERERDVRPRTRSRC